MDEKFTRREVMKRAAYIAPAILTLAAMPSFAQGGSGFQNGSTDKSGSNRGSHQHWGFLENFFNWLQKIF
jgi:hypothetical protein